MGKLKRFILTGIFACVLMFAGTGTAEVMAYSDIQIIPDSDSRYLNESEIADMSAQVLCYARNEIYARRGRTFDSVELQEYFMMQSWYYGYLSSSQFSEDVFNDYEVKNVALLLARENLVSPGGYVLDDYYSYKPVYHYVNESYAVPEKKGNTVVSGYIIPGSDTRYLTNSEISDLPIQILCYAKNEIYARRGRRFYSKELQGYFDQQSWYTGDVEPEDFSDVVFNDYENKIIKLLTDREFALASTGYVLDSAGYGYEAVYDFIGWGTQAGDSTFIFADSDARYLTATEVQSLSMQMACYAKNEIYARRGRRFQSKELQEYFNSKTWYNGVYAPEEFNENTFNKYESANIQALTAYEFSLSPSGYQLY